MYNGVVKFYVIKGSIIMNSFKKRMKKEYKESGKNSIIVYLVLRFLVIVSILVQIFSGNVFNAILCTLALTITKNLNTKYTIIEF